MTKVLFWIIGFFWNFLGYASIVCISAVPIYLMFFPKPKSAVMLIVGLLVVFFLNIAVNRIRLPKKTFLALSSRLWVPSFDGQQLLGYIKNLFMACVACDIAFDKNFAIIGCMATVLVFLGLSILHRMVANPSNIMESIVISTAICLVFALVYVRYGYYGIPVSTIAFMAVLLGLVHVLCGKIKQFDRTIMFAIATSVLMSFVSLSVIS